MRRLVFALDLKDDPVLIEAYKDWHRPGRTPPEVIASLRDAGVRELEIHRIGDRMFMIMDVDDHFSAERKATADADDPAVQAWERLMWTYQKPLPWSAPDQKWMPADRIFVLSDHRNS